MKYHLKMSTILVALSNPIAAVIPGDALVQSGSGVKMLHEVMVGERVLSANREMNGLAHERVLMNQCGGRRNSTIQINLGKRRIKAAPDQLFFDPLKEEWIKAEDLTAQNALFGGDLLPITILDVKRKSGLAMKTRMVNIASVHQLFVDGVLTHNMMWALEAIVAGALGEVGGQVTKAAINATADSIGATREPCRDCRGAQYRREQEINDQMVRDLYTGSDPAPTSKAECALGGTALSRHPLGWGESSILDPRLSIGADGAYKVNMDSNYTPPQPARFERTGGNDSCKIYSAVYDDIAPVQSGAYKGATPVKRESAPAAAPKAAAKAAPAPVTKKPAAAPAAQKAAPVKQAPAPAPKAVQAAPKAAAPVVQQSAPVAAPSLRQIFELSQQKKLASQAAAPQVAPQEAPKAAKRRNLF